MTTKSIIDPKIFTHIIYWKDELEQWRKRLITEAQFGVLGSQISSYSSHISMPSIGLVIPKRDVKMRALKPNELESIQQNYLRRASGKKQYSEEEKKQRDEYAKIIKWQEENRGMLKKVDKIAKNILAVADNRRGKCFYGSMRDGAIKMYRLVIIAKVVSGMNFKGAEKETIKNL